jgi:hypothetical protein
MENIFGQMEIVMRVIGREIDLMVWVYLSIEMVLNWKEVLDVIIILMDKI